MGSAAKASPARNSLDSPVADPLVKNIRRIFEIVGQAGVGGGRPFFGTFDVTGCQRISKEEKELLYPDSEV